MVKATIKKGLKWLLFEPAKKSKFFRDRKYWGYHDVPKAVLILNFIFQRIFGINGNVPWSVNYTSRVTSPENITIGENVGKSFAISGHYYIQAANGIKIGDNTIFASGVGMISANHSKTDLNHWEKEKPIIIGKNCWIGMGAIILPGVELGDSCIVGAGSVVTKSFSPNSVVAGNPASIIKSRTKTEIV